MYSGLFYDATHVLAEAMKETSSISGVDVQKALVEVEYEGVTGLTKFDSFGDVQKPFAVYVVKGGQFLPVSL